MIKWIIKITLPSGIKMAFSSRENKFALVQIKDDGVMRGVFVWDSEEDARTYLAKQIKIAPEVQKLGPFEFATVMVAQ